MVKTLKVFADCETFRFNLKSNTPSGYDSAEYSVSFIYEDKKGRPVEHVVNRWSDMIKILEVQPYKKYQIYCHNGDGFDFWYIRKAVMEDYGINPKNKYDPQSVNHINETRKKDLKGDYLLETHIKAKSKVNIEFRVNGKTYTTIDTYPKTMLSVKSLGEKLKTIGVKQGKQKYAIENYVKFDKSDDLTLGEKRRQQRAIFDTLTQEDIDYVMNDTRVIYQVWKHYNELFDKSYDWNKRTLSQNIGEQYCINALADFQIMHNLPQKMIDDLNLKHKKLEFTEYQFMIAKNGRKISMFDYMHNFYNGGMNLYNDDYIAQLLHDDDGIKHIDINSSYPTVMYYEKFPHELVDFSTTPKNIRLNKKYLYLLEISLDWLDAFMQDIPSHIIKSMFVKRFFRITNEHVYMTSIDLYNLNKFKNNPYKRLVVPCATFMKWTGRRFAGRKVIEVNYKGKNELKKQAKACKDEKERNLMNNLVANKKITLNGIYGIPALRAYFPAFNYVNGEFINLKDDDGHLGHKNSERNILFSVFVTAYSFRNLIDPLSYNVKDCDKGFIYTDTDSIFMYNWYWETIKNNVEIHPTKLGAWDLEHDHIDNIYVMNHKKYAFDYYNKQDNKEEVEVHSGGVRLEDYHAEDYNNLQDFVNERFHEGYKVSTQRSILTKSQVPVIYTGKVELQKGVKYTDKFNRYDSQEERIEDLLKYMRTIMKIMDDIENTDDEGIVTDEKHSESYYYETAEYGAITLNDIYIQDTPQDKINYEMDIYMKEQKIVLEYLDERPNKRRNIEVVNIEAEVKDENKKVNKKFSITRYNIPHEKQYQYFINELKKRQPKKYTRDKLNKDIDDILNNIDDYN